MHEKRIEPAAGLEVDERMRVLLAALACVPILELSLDCYAGFHSVIVYPDEFVVPDREYVDEDGVVHVGDDVLSGEAWEQGPVILSWPDVEASGRGDGYNVVAHELAHKLDMLDGDADGLPPSASRDERGRHGPVRSQPRIKIFAAVSDRDEEPWIDPYAAQDPAEFFAVCSELFFDVPDELREEYPVLYEQLKRYFRQDPAAAAVARSTLPREVGVNSF